MLRKTKQQIAVCLGMILTTGLGQAFAVGPCPRERYQNQNAGYTQGSGYTQGGCPWADNGWNKRAKPMMPKVDRPFPLGQVSDAFNAAQETNAEANDFILFDYEFVGETAVLNPKGRDHMTQIAVRLPMTPFPVVVEQTEKTNDPEENQRLYEIDELRRANVVSWLQKFYADDPSIPADAITARVVVAPDFNYTMRAEEALRNYDESGNGSGRGGHGGGRR